ncbi:hypothetical protein A3Q56_06970 [Intoshia linei]|uniref:SAM-dependent methyltransferase TRM5/TYW2-type domain-containing protein n=1 Tax=Intoshia linei TaxID=1819745 RepID=A0A177AVT7_9BILA|nr:hypothetical protein A3Q56_06970 [Intoshia linei]
MSSVTKAKNPTQIYVVNKFYQLLKERLNGIKKVNQTDFDTIVTLKCIPVRKTELHEWLQRNGSKILRLPNFINSFDSKIITQDLFLSHLERNGKKFNEIKTILESIDDLKDSNMKDEHNSHLDNASLGDIGRDEISKLNQKNSNKYKDLINQTKSLNKRCTDSYLFKGMGLNETDNSKKMKINGNQDNVLQNSDDSSIETEMQSASKNEYDCFVEQYLDYKFFVLDGHFELYQNYPDAWNLTPFTKKHTNKLLRPNTPNTRHLTLHSVFIDSNLNEPHLYINVLLGYFNLSYKNILSIVLDGRCKSPVAYTRVGDILHVNLSQEQMKYSEMIGKILNDRIPGIQSVVAKCDSITNKFRTSNLIPISGVADLITVINTYGIKMALNYRTVFYNSRLAGEHYRLAEVFDASDVVYDLFAGIGPFVMHIAKFNKCNEIYANELNEEAYKYLKMNCDKAKKLFIGDLRYFNLDAQHFIPNIIFEIYKTATEFKICPKKLRFNFIMNLPETSVNFLYFFKNTIPLNPNDFVHDLHFRMFMYFFHVKTDIEGKVHKNDEIKTSIFEKICDSLYKNKRDYVVEILNVIQETLNVRLIRGVAPAKDMYLAEFKLSALYCIGKKDDNIKFLD